MIDKVKSPDWRGTQVGGNSWGCFHEQQKLPRTDTWERVFRDCGNNQIWRGTQVAEGDGLLIR